MRVYEEPCDGESNSEFLKRLFAAEYCKLCGGDHLDHTVAYGPHRNLVARCKHPIHGVMDTENELSKRYRRKDQGLPLIDHSLRNGLVIAVVTLLPLLAAAIIVAIRK